MSDNLPLDTTIDLITVDPISGAITVDQSKPVGTYEIKVVGTLPDLQTYDTTFTINVLTNVAPVFSSNLL